MFDWSQYAVGGAASRPDSFTGLQPEFASGVYNMVQAAHAAGIPLQITSAYRSPEVQAKLFEDAVRKYGSPQAARKWVAPPGRSQHNRGTAVDFAVNGGLIRDANSPEAKWIKENAERFGLSVPMAWEPWQVEPMGSRDMVAGAGSDTLAGGLSILPNRPDRLEDNAMQPEKSGGLLGGLWDKTGLDEERRAMLAMALSGMSMRPNTGLQAAAQMKMKNASDRKTRNKTIDWLQSRGRDDLARAVASGALDGRSAAQLAMAPAQDERTALMQNVDYIMENNPGMSFNDALAQARSGVTVNNNAAPGESELTKTLGKKVGEQWAGYMSAGNVAAGRAQDFEILGQLMEMAPQGPIQGRLAQALPGFNSAADAVQSIVSRIAPTLRVEGSGSTSDIEYAGMLRSLPSLTNQPEGNRVILGVMQEKAQLDIARGQVVDDFNSGRISQQEASAQLRELDSKSIMTPELQSLMGNMQEPTGAPSAPNVLIYDPETGGFK